MKLLLPFFCECGLELGGVMLIQFHTALFLLLHRISPGTHSRSPEGQVFKLYELEHYCGTAASASKMSAFCLN